MSQAGAVVVANELRLSPHAGRPCRSEGREMASSPWEKGAKDGRQPGSTQSPAQASPPRRVDLPPPPPAPPPGRVDLLPPPPAPPPRRVDKTRGRGSIRRAASLLFHGCIWCCSSPAEFAPPVASPEKDEAAEVLWSREEGESALEEGEIEEGEKISLTSVPTCHH
ncbi:unnamed protein product [Urochloa humidicola]